MSFNRPNPVNIEHLRQGSPTVATLPVDPYANSPPNNSTNEIRLVIQNKSNGNKPDQNQPNQNNVLNVANYSEKVFVVFGDGTKIHKESLKGLGGKFNGRLKANSDTGFPGGAGWMFFHNHQGPVMDFVNKVNGGSISTHHSPPMQGGEGDLPNVVVPVRNNKFQTVRWKVFI